jgi:ribosome-associated heat shock protein Hsp15
MARDRSPASQEGGDQDDSQLAMRIDKLLWYLRLSPTRSAAQALVAAGHIRVDGRRVERASAAVRNGALIVFPGPPRVRVLRLISLPGRRGPPAEASACYIDMGLDGDIAPKSPSIR